MHSGWLLLGFILGLYWAISRLCWGQKFALELRNFWRKKNGVGVAHVWPMLGHVEAMLAPCWAYLRPFGGQLGPCWGCLAHVEWFGALMGSKINPNQTLVRLGFVLGLRCLCWESCWAKIGCSCGCSCYNPRWTRQFGPHWGYLGSMLATQFILATGMQRKAFNLSEYIIKNKVSTVVPLWLFELL